ncbi:MAG: Fe(2+)-trafficking protein [Chloroflexi bacterium]|nr:Fe(2+)-trafficking protein [Chloroflexota bacterium]
MAEITCARCGRRAEPLDSPPLVGARGQVVQQQICPACWQEWVEQSKNIINHYGIEVADPRQRQQLYAVMAEFLSIKF